jgi:hypothetical protein
VPTWPNSGTTGKNKPKSKTAMIRSRFTAEPPLTDEFAAIVGEKRCPAALASPPGAAHPYLTLLRVYRGTSGLSGAPAAEQQFQPAMLYLFDNVPFWPH